MKSNNMRGVYSKAMMVILFTLLMACEKNEKNEKITLTLPVVVTAEISNVSSNSIGCCGKVVSQGNSPLIECGFCWSKETLPTIVNSQVVFGGSSSGDFKCSINNLSAGTIYYIRAYAKNGAGVVYGSEKLVTTNESVIDIEGNVYNTVTIGKQVWMSENLRVTKYRNGDPIKSCSNYNNDSQNGIIYGKLYNWEDVADSRCIAPKGWHVPSKAEWEELIAFVGNNSGKLKIISNTYWKNDNMVVIVTNETGFSALPSGACSDVFFGLGQVCYWWSNELDKTSHCGIYTKLYYDDNKIVMSDIFTYHLHSVRCIKD